MFLRGAALMPVRLLLTAPAAGPKVDAPRAAPASKDAKAALSTKKAAVPEKKPSKAKDPAIKRAPSAFQLFQKEGFRSVMAANPEAKTFVERAKLVRDGYEALPETEKAVFVSKAAALKAETDKQKSAAAAVKKVNARPPTAFILFCGQTRPEMRAAHPEAKMTDIAKLLGAAWTVLPSDKKAVYQEVSVENRAKWEAGRAGKAEKAQ